MARYLFSILTIFCVQSAFAQNAKIDSLKALLPKTQGGARADLCLELAIELYGIDNHTCLAFAKESMNIATHVGDSLRMVKSGKVVGVVLRRLEKYDSAITIGLYLEKIAHRNFFNSEIHGDVLNGLGLGYVFLSRYDQALSCLQKAHSAYVKNDVQDGVYTALNNIGLIYYKLRNPELALTYYKKSLNVWNSYNHSTSTNINLLTNISLCYTSIDSLKEARDILLPVLERCPSECSDFEFTSALFTSGNIWYESDSLQKAENEFLRSYA
ncbi:MAG TPA: tetratricopeptide repeat protein, partial [Ohtaekwangia sp.]